MGHSTPRRRCEGGAVRRKTRPGHGREVRRQRRLLLERRHVRAEGLGVDGSAGQVRPDIASACRAAWAVRSTDAKFVRPGKAEFMAVPSESVDYAVMEKCPGVLRHPHAGAGCRLERSRRLGSCLAGDAERRRGQCTRGRRDGQRQPQHAGARHQPAGQRGRGWTTSWWWKRRRRARGQPREEPGREEHRQPARPRAARRAGAPSQGAPPLGLVRQHRPRPAPPGQAHHASPAPTLPKTAPSFPSAPAPHCLA